MKRFFLWKMGFSGAKIAPCPPYTPLGTIESSKGLRPSRALRGFFDSLVWGDDVAPHTAPHCGVTPGWSSERGCAPPPGPNSADDENVENFQKKAGQIV